MNADQYAETNAGWFRALAQEYKERSDAPQLARRYLWCRIVGHRPERDERFYWYCKRCQDTLPEGNVRRQP